MCEMMTTLMTQKPSNICLTPATQQDSHISKVLELRRARELKVCVGGVKVGSFL